MEAVKKKWFWGIFISLLTFFAMSHNVSAVNVNYDVGFSRKINVNGGRCAVQNGVFTTFTGNTCVWGTNVGGDLQGRGLSFIETQPINDINSGRVYEIYLTVSTANEAQLMVPAVWSPRTTANFNLIAYEQVSTNENIGSSATNEGYVSTYRFIIRPTTSGTLRLQLGDDTRQTNFVYLVGDPWSVVVDTRIESITEWIVRSAPSNTDIVNAINQLKQQELQQQQQERQELEQSQSDLQDAGADSTQDAQQGTASLLSAIGQAVGVISSASPTNCKLNGNMGNLNIGQLDLCANPAPAFVQTIGSLILILMCVPLAISLFNRFINLFRSFQS